jgi:hypothetical protein
LPAKVGPRDLLPVPWHSSRLTRRVILAGTGPGNRHSLKHNIRGTEASMKPNSSIPEGALLAELRRRHAELLG